MFMRASLTDRKPRISRRTIAISRFTANCRLVAQRPPQQEKFRAKVFRDARHVWRTGHPLFLRPKTAGPADLLLAAVVAIELAIVGITVLLNTWNNVFYNALQDRNWNAFVYQLGYFCVLAGIYIVLAVYQLYLNQWLQIRWRRWMTQRYLDHWLSGANHYRMQLLGDAADNPEPAHCRRRHPVHDGGGPGNGARMSIGLSLLNSVVTLALFIVILWRLSGQRRCSVFGTRGSIPGYLLWAALIYAVVGTVLTHLIGRALIALNFHSSSAMKRDFRFSLVRVRENSEQIALLEGERAERDRLLDPFRQNRRQLDGADDAAEETHLPDRGLFQQVSWCFPSSW